MHMTGNLMRYQDQKKKGKLCSLVYEYLKNYLVEIFERYTIFLVLKEC